MRRRASLIFSVMARRAVLGVGGKVSVLVVLVREGGGGLLGGMIRGASFFLGARFLAGFLTTSSSSSTSLILSKNCWAWDWVSLSLGTHSSSSSSSRLMVRVFFGAGGGWMLSGNLLGGILVWWKKGWLDLVTRRCVLKLMTISPAELLLRLGLCTNYPIMFLQSLLCYLTTFWYLCHRNLRV